MTTQHTPSKAEQLFAAKGRKGVVRYLNKKRQGDHECEHGHFGCAAEDDGPCGAEAESLIGTTDY